MDLIALRQRMMTVFKERLVCGPQTDIVIEGYPRSSNSFTVWMLGVLQGEEPYLSVAHHTHTTENLRLGLYFGKPIVVLVRPAEDAILSFMIYGDQSVEYATERYKAFYSGVLRLPEPPMAVRFETVVTDVNQVVTRINRVITARGCKPVPLSQDLAADIAKVKAIAREQAVDIHVGKVDQRVSVPNSLREEIKAARRSEVQAYLAKRPGVLDLYDRVLDYGY